MNLLILFLCGLLYGLDLGTTYPYYSKFLTISDVKGKLQQLSPNRLLQRKIANDFESAVTKSYGDMEILRYKQTNECAFFHVSTKSRILHGRKKYLAKPIETFFEGKDFNNFHLFGGFDPSLNLFAKEKNTGNVFEVVNTSRPREVFSDVGLYLLDLANINVALIPDFGFITQDKEKKRRELCPGYVGEENVEQMIADCDYIGLIQTEFAQKYALQKSSQILKLFHDCGAELPFAMNDLARAIRLDPTCWPKMSDRDWHNNMFVENLLAITEEQDPQQRIQILNDTENFETIVTKNFGNFQISRHKTTGALRFFNLETNLESGIFASLERGPYAADVKSIVKKLFSMNQDPAGDYEFYGSQDYFIFLARNKNANKVTTMSMNCVETRDTSSCSHSESTMEYTTYSTEYLGLGYVDFSDYNVFVANKDDIILQHKQNKDDIRDSTHSLSDQKIMTPILKNAIKNGNWADVVCSIPNEMRTSLQVLTMLQQNGMRIDDRICELWPSLANYYGDDKSDAFSNDLRCLYEREKLLKRMRTDNRNSMTPNGSKKMKSLPDQKKSISNSTTPKKSISRANVHAFSSLKPSLKILFLLILPIFVLKFFLNW